MDKPLSALVGQAIIDSSQLAILNGPVDQLSPPSLPSLTWLPSPQPCFFHYWKSMRPPNFATEPKEACLKKPLEEGGKEKNVCLVKEIPPKWPGWVGPIFRHPCHQQEEREAPQFGDPLLGIPHHLSSRRRLKWLARWRSWDRLEVFFFNSRGYPHHRKQETHTCRESEVLNESLRVCEWDH